MNFQRPSLFPKNPPGREAAFPLVMLGPAGPLPRRLRQHDGGSMGRHRRVWHAMVRAMSTVGRLRWHARRWPPLSVYEGVDLQESALHRRCHFTRRTGLGKAACDEATLLRHACVRILAIVRAGY